jgi:hypothetical protein
MSDVWEHSDRVCCTHPGWQRLDGWASVSASFFAIFTGPQPIQFILTSERAEIVGDMAMVVVDENILGGDAGSMASAVNVFLRAEDGWRMLAHAASQVITA